MDTGQAPALLWESLARFGGVLSPLPRVEGGVGFGRRPFNVSDSGGYGACANPSRFIETHHIKMSPGGPDFSFTLSGTGAIGAGCNGGGWNRAYATIGRTGSRRLSSGCRGNHGPRRSEPVKLPARCVPKSTLRENQHG